MWPLQCAFLLIWATMADLFCMEPTTHRLTRHSHSSYTQSPQCTRKRCVFGIIISATQWVFILPRGNNTIVHDCTRCAPHLRIMLRVLHSNNMHTCMLLSPRQTWFLYYQTTAQLVVASITKPQWKWKEIDNLPVLLNVTAVWNGNSYQILS